MGAFCALCVAECCSYFYRKFIVGSTLNLLCKHKLMKLPSTSPGKSEGLKSASAKPCSGEDPWLRPAVTEAPRQDGGTPGMRGNAAGEPSSCLQPGWLWLFAPTAPVQSPLASVVKSTADFPHLELKLPLPQLCICKMGIITFPCFPTAGEDLSLFPG